MHISLSPQRRDGSLTVIRLGDALRINGDLFDFSSLPEGATLPAGEVPSEWVFGPVERIGGTLHLTLVLPHGPNPSLAVAFPAPLFDPPSGVLAIPSDPVQEEPSNVDA